MKINIPNPCTKYLDELHPTDSGMYCNSCATTVIDFRDWDAEEIKSYFKNKTEKTCGIFYKSQLEKKEETIIIAPQINYENLSFSQRFLYALFICFGAWLFGCKEPAPVPEKVTFTEGIIIEDSLIHKEIDTTKTILFEKEIDASEIKKADDILKLIEAGNVQMKLPETSDIIQLDEKEIIAEKKIEGEAVWFGTIEVYARFQGGDDSLKKFIQNNLQYPEYERLNQIEGRVYVRFTIDEDGNVDEPRILRGVNGAVNFDAEVIRIIQLMPKWKPGRIGDKNIEQQFTLPIEFKL